MNYKEIKSYEDACKALNIQPISENAVVAFPKADRKSMLAYHKLTVIARALNEGWQPDWSNKNEYKYYPIFRYINAGLSYASTNSAASYTYAYIGSRLCFKTEAISDYAAATFADLYKDFYCLPASADDEETPKVQMDEEERAKFNKLSEDDFLKIATRITETQIVPLVENSKTRGVVLIACDVETTDKKGKSATGSVVGACGNSKAIATGIAELMTRPETRPLVKKAAELATIKKIQEKIEREGANFFAELLNEPIEK